MLGKPAANEATKEDLGMNVMALKWMSNKWVGRVRTGFIWLRKGANGGLLQQQ
jgi:hypothetical protein